jgi:hypothetical protein
MGDNRERLTVSIDKNIVAFDPVEMNSGDILEVDEIITFSPSGKVEIVEATYTVVRVEAVRNGR